MIQETKRRNQTPQTELHVTLCDKTCLLIRFKPACNAKLQRPTWKIENLLVARLDMVLSNKRITKAQIRLRGCAGWSAPLLFANTEDKFSRADAQIISVTVVVGGVDC